MTTKYLVDTNSVTGYAQVLQELQGANVVRKYTYGLQLISENQLIGNTQTVSFYGFDGHGSVRQLTDRFGAVSDTYAYDAFGNLLSATGSTPNLNRFASEQFDLDLGLYYNRARYLDVRQGRFWGMDVFEAGYRDPQSLHKYLYAKGNPINSIDPTGHETLGEVMAVIAISIAVLTINGCSSAPQRVNVKTLGFQLADYGVEIIMEAYTKNRMPHYDKFRWVQLVTTNAIRKKDIGLAQPDVPYLDPPYNHGFFNTDAEQKESNEKYGDGDLSFYDNPRRDPHQNPEVHGTIYWHADLYLVGMTGDTSYDKVTHIGYGFKVFENGETKVEGDPKITRLIP